MNQDRLLLDTHAFLWWRADDAKLLPPAREAIGTASVVYVSAASAWEAGIKAALGKLRLPEPLSAGVAKSGFLELPVTFAHAEAAARLPPHHADPFDRMLIAQAGSEGLTLVTHDRRVGRYRIAVLWT